MKEEKVHTATTTTGLKTVQTSADEISLEVTNEGDLNNMVHDYRKGFHKSLGGFRDDAKALGQKKRLATYRDLDAALAIIMVIKQPEHVSWLADVIEKTGVPVVEDEAKNNIFVMYCRILMGAWAEKPKGWKVGDPEPAFTWSENVWTYASVLRAAYNAGLRGRGDLYERLVADKGYGKLRNADKKDFDNDQVQKDKVSRFKAVTATKRALIPAQPFANVKQSGLVLLFGTVSADKQEIEVHGLLDESPAAVAARVTKYAETYGKDAVHAQQLAAKDAEIARAHAKVQRSLEFAKERLSELGENIDWPQDLDDDAI